MPVDGVPRKNKVILVGVGGATCSGKTTLAKHLNRILPDSVIIHQDDFAPPQELVPIHPVYQVQDWDAAPGAISWSRLVDFLRHVKITGVIPPDHRSHDHLNEQKDIPIEDEVKERWIREFVRMKEEREAEANKNNEQIVWGLVDGFLLYWHQDVIDQLDVRIMLRVPHDVLKKRRHERHGYHTAGKLSHFRLFIKTLMYFLRYPSLHSISMRLLTDWLGIDLSNANYIREYVTLPCNLSPHHQHGVQSDPEGSLWRDPPNYWEQIVYPAYVDAYKELFIDGDVEHGALSGNKARGLILLETLDISMGEAVERCCKVLKETLES